MKRTVLPLLIAAWLTMSMGACAFVGPKAIRASRFSYNDAVISTWNEQLLLNLVRLRYRDTPYFLEISSVSTQYDLTSGALAGTSVDVRGRGESLVTGGASFSYSERPTITYSPLHGEEFTKQIMSSIPLETLLLLGNGGWSIERILRTCVQKINEIPNAPTAAGPTPNTEPEFVEFQRISKLLRKLQQEGLLRVGVSSEKNQVRVLFDISSQFPLDPQVKELKQLLSLEGGRSRYFLVNNPVDPGRGEIALNTRSFLGIMFYISQSVEVPEQDRLEGKVTTTLSEGSEQEFDWSKVTDDLMRIQSSTERPQGSFVKVRYRGSWFFIDDTDLTSKSTFMLLAQLFWLQAGDVKSVEPMLTLPVG